MNESLNNRIRRLERRAGRPMVELVEWMLVQLEPKIRRAAFDLGFNATEAEQIANATMAGAVKSLNSGIESVRLERQFRRQG